jgi:hypothetical protein
MNAHTHSHTCIHASKHIHIHTYSHEHEFISHTHRYTRTHTHTLTSDQKPECVYQVLRFSLVRGVLQAAAAGRYVCPAGQLLPVEVGVCEREREHLYTIYCSLYPHHITPHYITPHYTTPHHYTTTPQTPHEERPLAYSEADEGGGLFRRHAAGVCV